MSLSREQLHSLARHGAAKRIEETGRVIPLNDKATKVLKFWADQFPARKPEHFVFPSERYGAGEDRGRAPRP